MPVATTGGGQTGPFISPPAIGSITYPYSAFQIKVVWTPPGTGTVYARLYDASGNLKMTVPDAGGGVAYFPFDPTVTGQKVALAVTPGTLGPKQSVPSPPPENPLMLSARQPVGGGWLRPSTTTEIYYATTDESGPAQFRRTEPRLDFNWFIPKPGGANDPGYTVGPTNWSINSTRQLIPNFTETYTFTVQFQGGVKVQYKLHTDMGYTTLLNYLPQADGNYHSHSATASLTAGALYDFQIDYSFGTTPFGILQLGWSSPSTPQEIIDQIAEVGNNVTVEDEEPCVLASSFADIAKAARGTWNFSGGGGQDANGWPTADCGYTFSESLVLGLGVDPLMVGTVTYSFIGQATITYFGNVNPSSPTQSYDSGSNTTSGTFVVEDLGFAASDIIFTNTKRLATDSPGTGFTNLTMMRPLSPGSGSSFATDITFIPDALAYLSAYTILRHQLEQNFQTTWSTRTTGNYFNQASGLTSVSTYSFDTGATSPNGMSIEYKIILANMTGTDIHLGSPLQADPTYWRNNALAIAYGTDGVTPYTSPQANPVYPPLNPNLRVVVELANELWNFGFADYQGLKEITATDADAENANYVAFNYDNQTRAKDAFGKYVSLPIWIYRKAIQLQIQQSNVWRSVFGDNAMNNRIRFTYLWQYANVQGTGTIALQFADDFYNKANQTAGYAIYSGTAKPISYYLTYGGGASYYSVANPTGVTTILPDPDFFAATGLSAGYNQNPSGSGSGYTYSGTAGIAVWSMSNTDHIPVAYLGDNPTNTQMGYVTGNGAYIEFTFDIPASQTSDVYAIVFKAMRRNVSGTDDAQNLSLSLDGTAINAKSALQNGSYYDCPSDYSGIPWAAANSSTVASAYYFTVIFSGVESASHTVRITGIGSGCVFLGEFRVASVDAILSDLNPVGGAAFGQPPLDLVATLNSESALAKIYGLINGGYEGSIELGGDDGGSTVQNAAKFGDARMGTVNLNYLVDAQQSGAGITIAGTYEQVFSWSDNWAVDNNPPGNGIIDADTYALVSSVTDLLSQQSAFPINGYLLPNYLYPIASVFNTNVSGGNEIGPWGSMAWTFSVASTGTYTFSIPTSGTGNYIVLLTGDQGEVQVGTQQTAGSTYTLTVNGITSTNLHGFKIRSVDPTNTVGVGVVTVIGGSGSVPAAVGSLTISGDTTSATISWSSVATATSYVVRWGTTSGFLVNIQNVPSGTTATVTGLTANTISYFEVVAVNSSGTGLPSDQIGWNPLPISTSGILAQYSTASPQYFAGGPSTLIPGIDSTGCSIGPMTLGSGFQASQRVGLSNSGFYFVSITEAYQTTAAAAISAGEYLVFEVTPISSGGNSASFSALAYNWQVWYDTSTSFETQYSLDGSTWVTLTTSTVSTTPGFFSFGWLTTADLTGVPDLQGISAPFYIRLVPYGSAAFSVLSVGFAFVSNGNPAGSPQEALTLTGTWGPISPPTLAAPLFFYALTPYPVMGGS